MLNIDYRENEGILDLIVVASMTFHEGILFPQTETKKAAGTRDGISHSFSRPEVGPGFALRRCVEKARGALHNLCDALFFVWN